jgi:hypothetical protein
MEMMNEFNDLDENIGCGAVVVFLLVVVLITIIFNLIF